MDNVYVSCHYHCSAWDWSNDGTCNDRRESIQCIEKKELLFDQNFLKELTKDMRLLRRSMLQ